MIPYSDDYIEQKIKDGITRMATNSESKALEEVIADPERLETQPATPQIAKDILELYGICARYISNPETDLDLDNRYSKIGEQLDKAIEIQVESIKKLDADCKVLEAEYKAATKKFQTVSLSQLDNGQFNEKLYDEIVEKAFNQYNRMSEFLRTKSIYVKNLRDMRKKAKAKAKTLRPIIFHALSIWMMLNVLKEYMETNEVSLQDIPDAEKIPALAQAICSNPDILGECNGFISMEKQEVIDKFKVVAQSQMEVEKKNMKRHQNDASTLLDLMCDRFNVKVIEPSGTNLEENKKIKIQNQIKLLSSLLQAANDKKKKHTEKLNTTEQMTLQQVLKFANTMWNPAIVQALDIPINAMDDKKFDLLYVSYASTLKKITDVLFPDCISGPTFARNLVAWVFFSTSILESINTTLLML